MVDTVNRISRHVVQISGQEGKANPLAVVKNGEKRPYKTYSLVHEHKRKLRKSGHVKTYIALYGSQKNPYNRTIMVCRARSLAEARDMFRDEYGAYYGKREVRMARKEDFLLLCNFKKRDVCTIGQF